MAENQHNIDVKGSRKKTAALVLFGYFAAIVLLTAFLVPPAKLPTTLSNLASGFVVVVIFGILFAYVGYVLGLLMQWKHLFALQLLACLALIWVSLVSFDFSQDAHSFLTLCASAAFSSLFFGVPAVLGFATSKSFARGRSTILNNDANVSVMR